MTLMPTPTKPAASPDASSSDTLSFAIEAARMVRDDKCEDVVLLDVRELSQVTDYIIIASGSSDRQMHSVLRHVEELARTRRLPAFRSNADERSTWLLVDFVDLVVHLFEPNTRAHYDLEMLWGDAPRIAWERPDQLQRDRAGLNT
jgi:ribosome-associated protein